jgi:hypothetical protein
MNDRRVFLPLLCLVSIVFDSAALSAQQAATSETQRVHRRFNVSVEIGAYSPSGDQAAGHGYDGLSTAFG